MRLLKCEPIQIWGYTNMMLQKYEVIKIWGCTNMRLYKYEDKQPLRIHTYEAVQIWDYTIIMFPMYTIHIMTWKMVLDLTNWHPQLICWIVSETMYFHFLQSPSAFISWCQHHFNKQRLSRMFSPCLSLFLFFHKSCQVRVLFHVIHSHFVALQLQ